jgi:hypothetical protein
MKLTTTNDKLQVVLGGAVTTNQLQCFTSYKIYTATTTGDNRVAINTNNTTDVDLAGAPGSGETFDIQNINIYNADTVAQTVTIKFDLSGTEKILYKGIVGVGDVISWAAEGGWRNTSNNITPLLNNKKCISGSLYETIDRDLCDEVNTAVLSSGRLSGQAIWLPAGVTINSISFWSATTAAGTPTNQLFGLFDSSNNLLRSSVNDTTTAWAANSKKTLALTSVFTTTYSGLYYLGIMVTATTVPTLKGNTAKTGGQLNAAAPSMGGTSTTGLTTALPATAAAFGTVTTSFWGCVS